MSNIGSYSATTEMAQAHDAVMGEALSCFQRMVTAGNQLFEAMTAPRPAQGVQNGAYQRMNYVFESCFQSAQGLVLMFPDEQGRDWFPWMVLRNRYARRSLDPILPPWMQSLIDKNNGIIPDTWSNEDVKG